MTETLAEQTRLCRECGEPRPLHQFRPRHRDGHLRQTKCTPCHNLAERLRRAAKRDRAFARYVRDMARLRDVDRVSMLTKAMLAKFGGLDGFVAEWKTQYDHAVAAEPGGENARRHLMAVLGLLQVSWRIDEGRY